MNLTVHPRLVFVLFVLMFLISACEKDEISPEKVVSTFLEAASFADIDTMKELCAGKMKDELLRDEQALTKLVYFERQNSQANADIVKDSGINADKKISSRFSFDYTIMKEQTKINDNERAQVWVILTRKNISITRSYDLVWANDIWLIENYTNQVGE